MTYHAISGLVSSLQISKGDVDLGFTSNDDRTLTAGGALVAAVLGDAVNATAVTGPTHQADVELESFSCKVGDQEVAGTFYKVESVKLEAGKYVAVAAIDRAKKFIWVHPYKTRGHRAQLRHDVLWGVILVGGLPALIAAFETYSTIQASGHFDWFGVLTGAGLVLLFGVIYFLVRRRFSLAAHDATEIFAALGYTDPAHVDLTKSEGFAAQFKGITGDDWAPSEPWRYRC